jgi:hypothetical protein
MSRPASKTGGRTATRHVAFQMATTASCTLGIDLASQPGGTAACVIEWRPGGPRTVPLTQLFGTDPRLHDSNLVELILRPEIDKVAIDAPFGWPVEFVDAVVGWLARQEWPVAPGDPSGDQGLLVLRETDREVIRATGLPLEDGSAARRGKRPLSVTTNWLAFTAMRCARLLAEVGRRAGEPVDRSGAGRVIEVYPDAALREWGVWPASWDQQHIGYKGTKSHHRERRRTLVDELVGRVGSWLGEDHEFIEGCVKSDDELDALVGALVARSVDQGNSQPIADPKRAAAEGWIHLPQRRSLESLDGVSE